MVVKLSSIVSEGVFPKGMPNWESNVEDHKRLSTTFFNLVYDILFK